MDLESVLTKMAANAEAIRSLVQGASDEQARWKPDEATWSTLEVIDHLVDEESTNFRARLGSAFGHPDQPCPTVAPGDGATQRKCNDGDLGESIQRFLSARQESVAWLHGLSSPDWGATCTTGFGPISAWDILASWQVHDLLHVRQLVDLQWMYPADVWFETQLQMVWPDHRRHDPPSVRLPSAYRLRTYQPGDEVRFYEVMELAGWPGWDGEKLQPWVERMLPGGWFMAVHEESGVIVATNMAIYSDAYPSGGELGWLAGDPSHSGNGLGLAVAAAVTARFLEAGCHPIHLYSEDFRLPALKTYLRLGYIPLLFAPEISERWQVICAQLQWPFTPERWRSQTPQLLREAPAD